MARITITLTQVIWLRQAAQDGTTRKDMAAHLGVCEDTCRRILHKHGIMKFEGGKYNDFDSNTKWMRPCLKCKSDKPRPKWQYVCDRCKSASEVEGLPDDFLRII